MAVIELTIPQALVDEVRQYTEEQSFGLFMGDEIKWEILPKIINTDNVHGSVVDAMYNGFVHNHLTDSGFSELDLRFMIPGLIYVLVTPSKVIAMCNGEEIPCVLS